MIGKIMLDLQLQEIGQGCIIASAVILGREYDFVHPSFALLNDRHLGKSQAKRLEQ